MKTPLVGLVAAGLFACSASVQKSPPGSTGGESVRPTAPVTPPTPAKTTPSGPAGEKAAVLREAADQIDKASDALGRGNKNLAEQLFSTAELLVGPDAVASIAPIFREGAPPRVTTPTTKVDTTSAPQPHSAGSSEEDDEAAKVPPPPTVGTLTGHVQVDGKPAPGSFGLVTLEPIGGKVKTRSPKKVSVEQRGREFLPHLTAISVGSTVSFPNFDTVFHNVFSTSPQGSFDLGIYKAGEARDFTFKKEGIIRLGCNLHANMSAYIAVVAAPAYVVTDSQGEFAFKRLAPGKYKLSAWSEKSSAPVTQEITIKTGKNDVTLGVKGDAPAGPQPDKFGGKRG